MANSLRYRARAVLYGTRLGRAAWRLVPPARGAADHDRPEYWNAELAGRMAAPNRNGRMNNELRDLTTLALVRQCGPVPRRVLDVGCAYGTLARALAPEGLEHYVGVDLSDLVVEYGHRAHAGASWASRFVASDLRDFTPAADARFDVIVFNEVLYYLPIDEAVAEVRRAQAWLDDGGVICVNMKDDPKCHAIYDALHQAFTWIYGTIYQQRPHGPRYALTIDRASPAYLAAVFAREGAVR